jgi:hypothetical protein
MSSVICERRCLDSTPLHRCYQIKNVMQRASFLARAVDYRTVMLNHVFINFINLSAPKGTKVYLELYPFIIISRERN